MADTYTTNLNLTKPEPGAAEDTWGISLNADLDSLDAIFGSGGTAVSMGAVTLDGLTVDSGTASTTAATFSSDLSNTWLRLESGADSGVYLGSNSGTFRLLTNTTNRLAVDGNGDISFYDDSGTSQNLKWDASADSLNFVDNAKAQFGASNDLQIYHSGSHSYIVDQGAGDLRIYADNEIRLGSWTTGKIYFDGTSNGSARLYNNGSAKLETTSSGVNISGTVTSDGLVVNGEINGPPTNNLTIRSKYSATIDIDSDNNQTDRNFQVIHDGSKLLLKAEESGDISFYDSAGTTQGFFWDSSAESLGIGTTSPTSILEVRGDGGNNKQLRLSTGATTYWDLGRSSANGNFEITEDSGDTYFTIDKTSGDATFSGTVTMDGLTVNSDTILLDSGSSAFMKIDRGSNSTFGIARYYTAGVEDWRLGTINDSTSNFYLQDASSIKRFQVATNGDISFYDDTGSTQGLFWDASAENLFVGGTTTTNAQGWGRQISSINSGTNGAALTLKDSNGEYQLATYANNFYLSQGANTRFLINYQGKVGIGTTSPSEALSVSGNAELGSANNLYLNNGGYDGAGTHAAIRWFSTGSAKRKAADIITAQADSFARSDLLFRTQSGTVNADPTEVMRVTHDNNVGIGTTSPAVALDIAGSSTTQMRVQMSGQADTRVLSDTGTGIVGTYSNHPLNIKTNGSTVATIDTSGNVGIGTTSPEALLHVSAADGVTGVLKIEGGKNTVTSIGEINSQLDFGSNDASVNGTGQVGGRIASVTEFTNGAETGMAFYTFDQGTTDLSEKLRITAEGNIGIGTDSPVGNLHIHSSTTESIMQMTNSSTGSGIADGFRFGAVGTSVAFINREAGIMSFSTSNSEVGRFDSSGNFLVGATSYAGNSSSVTGSGLSDGYMWSSRSANAAAIFNRLSTDGEIALFRKDGTTVGNIGCPDGANGSQLVIAAGPNGTNTGVGLRFTSFTVTNIIPCYDDGSSADNLIDLGNSGARFDDIYATNGTIQTSDRNEKQDIQALTDAEQRVATACKGLIRRFRWQDAVEEKGDDARLHFGVIAQDLQDAFTAEGLDAGDYGMFISSTWEDDDGVEQTRLGVRYNELLAFIITTL